MSCCRLVHQRRGITSKIVRHTVLCSVQLVSSSRCSAVRGWGEVSSPGAALVGTQHQQQDHLLPCMSM
jgi:hypothetical protein